jgi:endonuclease III
MAVARETRLKQALQRAEKRYGKTVQPKKTYSPADFLLFLLLTRNHPREIAERTFHALKNDFVDWNEVRVSSVREIGLSMKMKDPAAKEAEARAIRDCLTQIFRKKNNLSLGFLRETDFERGVKTLASLDGVDLTTSVQVALHVDEVPGIQCLPQVLRVSRRIGLVEKRAGAARARETLSGLVSGADIHRFHRLMLLVGEDTCQVKVMRCGDCCVNDVCTSSKVRPSGGRSGAGERAARGTRSSSRGAARGSRASGKTGRPRARKK